MKLFGIKNILNLMKLDAEGGAGAGSSGSGTEGSNPGAGNDGKGGDPNKDKTFTQEDINRIATKEKGEGRVAAFKAMGFEDEKSAKEWLEKARKAETDALNDTQKATKEKEEATKTAAAEKARADAAEQKLAAISSGVDPKYVDDVTVLAKSKMSETVDFKAALEEVKKAYPNFFNAAAGSNSGNGTGNSGNGARGTGLGAGKEGFGKRLAESKLPSKDQKPFSFFESN